MGTTALGRGNSRFVATTPCVWLNVEGAIGFILCLYNLDGERYEHLEGARSAGALSHVAFTVEGNEGTHAVCN